jgi:hypothetical protein
MENAFVEVIGFYEFVTWSSTPYLEWSPEFDKVNGYIVVKQDVSWCALLVVIGGKKGSCKRVGSAAGGWEGEEGCGISKPCCQCCSGGCCQKLPVSIDMDPIAVQASSAITSHYLRNHRNIPTKSWLLQSRKFYPSPITGLSSCTHDKAVAPHLYQTQICTSSGL